MSPSYGKEEKLIQLKSGWPEVEIPTEEAWPDGARHTTLEGGWSPQPAAAPVMASPLPMEG